VGWQRRQAAGTLVHLSRSSRIPTCLQQMLLPSMKGGPQPGSCMRSCCHLTGETGGIEGVTRLR
jgi:hypothetical protein